jgi:hypothetical protein
MPRDTPKHLPKKTTTMGEGYTAHTEEQPVLPVPKQGSQRKWDLPGLLDGIVERARKGYSRTDAFRLAGINPQTGWDWIAQGRKDPEKYPELVDFALRLEKAEAEIRAEMVDVVIGTAKSQAPQTWQAAMTYLERRDPENWGKREKTQVEIYTDQPLAQLNQIVLVDDGARQVSREMLRRVTASGVEFPAREIPPARRELSPPNTPPDASE